MNSDPILFKAVKLKTLDEFAKVLNDHFQSIGWYVHNEKDFFGVGTFFKNGKPKKTPSIAIRYFDPSYKEIFDADSGEMVQVKKELTGRERPWRVDSWRFENGRTFSSLDSAMDIFLLEVRESDPATAKGMYAGHP
jgi:hypothetical protein